MEIELPSSADLSDDEIEDLIDAIDHIMRVANASRTQTRRMRWIVQRCKSALLGDDDWRDIDIPPGINPLIRENQILKAKLAQATGDDTCL